MSRIEHAKRGLRRKNTARKKHQARRLYPHDTRARNANHLATCSCECCGNPRRHRGNSHTRTLSELRSIDKMHDELMEYEGARDEALAA